MQSIRPRESVILAANFDSLLNWYQQALGFSITRLFDDGYHYCNIEHPSGIKLGIGSTSEMDVEPTDRKKNTVILQFEVDDVQLFLDEIERTGGSVSMKASFSEKDNFWFGGFSDPEGNPFWVVDKNCP